MWLLSTDRAELHFFRSVQAAQVARFAILSHVWDETEQTFQETQALRVQCASANSNPRDFCSAKVRKSCKLAEKHGFKWIWNDACCIDKTSSSELSEAINSMFAYYSHADVCYAYLRDVPQPVGELDYYNDAFRKSKWFQRGWTLQELLAPQLVIFLSAAWTIMGTKARHAREVSEITRIPVSVLLLEEEIWDMSIARRMSWASIRETTRPEDEAYCLLGIFDIHMPPIYGEGRKAFQRLQEELMKKSVDLSLFAWGVPPIRSWRESDVNHAAAYLLAPSPAHYYSSGGTVFARDTLHRMYDSVLRQQRGLPLGTRLNKSRTKYPPQLRGIPTFEFTPYGIRARLPTHKTRWGYIGILFVSDQSRGGHICLKLDRCHTPDDQTHPLYRTDELSSRLNVLEPDDYFSQKTLEGRTRWEQFLAAPWTEIYFAHGPPQSLSTVRLHMNRDITAPFFIPSGILAELTQRRPEIRLVSSTFRDPRHAPPRKDSFSVATLVFEYRVRVMMETKWYTRFHLGLCSTRESSSRAFHWVVAEFDWKEGENHAGNRATHSLDTSHDCSTDHVDDWPHHTRSWGFGAIRLVLSFARSQINPQTYVLTRIGI